jgi:hypothetical protein
VRSRDRGPTWRADIWTVLEHTPGLSVAEVARRSGSSFAVAWEVVQDLSLLHRAGAAEPGAAGPTTAPWGRGDESGKERGDRMTKI